MSKEIAAVVEEVKSGRVFTVEDGGVWFSGMNAHVGRLVHKVGRALRESGYEVGLAFPQNGGLFLQVPDAVDLENNELDDVVDLGEPRGTEAA